jgi:hypothetical protein
MLPRSVQEFHNYMAKISRAEVDPPDAGEYFNMLNDNVQRYEFCRAMMCYYRTMWYRGKAEQERIMIDLPTRSMRIRYKRQSYQARKLIGTIKWVRSLQARDIADAEQRFCRWALFYQGEMDGSRSRGKSVSKPRPRMPHL